MKEAANCGGLDRRSGRDVVQIFDIEQSAREEGFPPSGRGCDNRLQSRSIRPFPFLLEMPGVTDGGKQNIPRQQINPLPISILAQRPEVPLGAQLRRASLVLNAVFFTLTPGWCNTIRFRCFSNRLPVRPSCIRCRFCSGLRFCTLTNMCQQIGCILPRVCFLTEGLIRNHRRNCR